METSSFLHHSGLFAATAAALGMGWIVALSSALAQGGLLFAPTSLLPAASRISPAKLKQFFSITALRGLMSLLPATWLPMLVSVACPATGSRSDPHVALREWRSRFCCRRVFEMAWKSALVLLVWSVLDYLFERRHFSSELKMSRQEVADEYKETEGNPIIKGRIRRLQRQAPPQDAR